MKTLIVVGIVFIFFVVREILWEVNFKKKYRQHFKNWEKWKKEQ